VRGRGSAIRQDHRSGMPGRALLVSQVDPWGDNSGARTRQRLVVESLGRDHVIDLVVISHHRQLPSLAAHPALTRVVNIELEPAVARTRARGRWLLRGDRPLELNGRDQARPRSELKNWMRGSYDLVWVTRSATYDVVAPVLPEAPLIVDLDDLEGEKLRGRISTTSSERPRGVGSVNHRLHTLRDLRNARCWDRFDRAVASHADATLVCSELDRQRLDAPRARVLPNGYVQPRAARGRVRVSPAPTILLQGELTYAPNVDGAEWFASVVFPLVRAALPQARLRLVGRSGRRVQRLQQLSGVTVTGFVPDMEDELARADLVVVPVRYGGGTRIKVLEAWAHQIPLVSTPLGAEGLDGVAGRHLLESATAQGFAACCLQLLADESLRRRLVADAHALFLQRYEHATVVARAADLIAEVETAWRPRRPWPRSHSTRRPVVSHASNTYDRSTQ
jgi:glycosyltransferase involved in cell wall biosynthesis